MIFQNQAELHNVAELIPGEKGYTICRVPAAVQDAMLHPKAGNNWSGTELRFVIEEGNEATVLLYLPEENRKACLAFPLYLGNHQFSWKWIEPRWLEPGMNELKVTLPDNMESLEAVSKEYGDPFSSRVVRIVMPSGNYEICGVEGKVRPPKPEELPARRAVFYGSSITHGNSGVNSMANYVSVCGRQLKLNAHNLGMSGSCYVEPELLDYVLSFKDAAFLSVEVGTNCAGNLPGRLSDEELQRRVEHLVNGFKADPGDRHLFIIDCLGLTARWDTCRQIVRDAVKNSGCPRIHYVCGMSLLPNRQYLVIDGVHPSLDGQYHIGLTYSELLRQYL